VVDTAPPRAALRAARAHAGERLAALHAEFAAIIAASEGANGDDEHDPEGATVAFERSRVAALCASARRQCDLLDRALARLDAGEYGRCARCRAPIGAERLRAVPTTEVCLACAASDAAALSRTRPLGPRAARIRRGDSRDPR
jgi:RNA polymerase-binding transcription factor DksA